MLKDLPDLKVNDDRVAGMHHEDDSNTELVLRTPPKRSLSLLPPTTPHNAIGLKEHKEALLREFDSLEYQGVELQPGTRERVQQMTKSAQMSMAREAIQIETNR